MNLLEFLKRGAQTARSTIADVRVQRQAAEVANRPKKRPGKRLRSSITMRAGNRPMSLLI
ncbi:MULTISPECIES: hypothetical protein [unclassified Nitrobacter]|uniref:hypothetical protein n=1 Tax=unclassified Nitrobacter TaxID=2620411 RepID=UPI0013EFB72C|nr:MULTISPECIES: hypothetical protein [unclassified Nitrobacter]MCB1392783.1 hypothetical protein [Nitrobacter sp.]MCV0385459.1 hypothetical protein [Nitrobacter sp.]